MKRDEPRPNNLATMPPPAPPEWQSHLIMVGNPPHPQPTFVNALIALRHAPEWQNVLSYNEFSDQMYCSDKPWTDNDDRLTCEWLQMNGIIVSIHTAAEAARTVAFEHVKNSLRDYLVELEWDGWARVNTWLEYYFGADDTLYNRAVGRSWLVSAIARAFDPGCKADCCLILEGDQGIGKSSAVEALAGKGLYSDALGMDLSGKESALLCTGTWIIELSELESLKRSEIGAVKAFLSRNEDHFRPLYARHAVRIPRQCVFIGTTNSDVYLHDASGGRRFWPVRCSKVELDQLRRDRDQLWAEALNMYLNKMPWWLDKDLDRIARTQQEERYDPHPWQDMIEGWLEGRQTVSVTEILTELISKPIGECTQVDQNHVAQCLHKLGWQKFREGKTEGGKVRRAWKYRKKPKYLSY